MKIALPHDLGREEARRRLKERSHEIADHIPGGMASVETHWPTADRMQLSVGAMGQSVSGTIEVSDSQLLFEISLPPMLSFLRPVIEGAVRAKGTRLLENR